MNSKLHEVHALVEQINEALNIAISTAAPQFKRMLIKSLSLHTRAYHLLGVELFRFHSYNDEDWVRECIVELEKLLDNLGNLAPATSDE